MSDTYANAKPRPSPPKNNRWWTNPWVGVGIAALLGVGVLLLIPAIPSLTAGFALASIPVGAIVGMVILATFTIFAIGAIVQMMTPGITRFVQRCFAQHHNTREEADSVLDKLQTSPTKMHSTMGRGNQKPEESDVPASTPVAPSMATAQTTLDSRRIAVETQPNTDVAPTLSSPAASTPRK